MLSMMHKEKLTEIFRFIVILVGITDKIQTVSYPPESPSKSQTLGLRDDFCLDKHISVRYLSLSWLALSAVWLSFRVNNIVKHAYIG